MIHALETATASQKQELVRLMEENPADKVEKVLNVFRDCGVDEWALRLKQQYLDTAIQHLEDIAVLSARKEPLKKLASFLIQREH